VTNSQPTDGADGTIRVLLWSPAGSGTHYHGPGSFAYRLYSAARPGAFEVTLAHGFSQQPEHDLFVRQHLVAPYDGRPRRMWPFILAGRRWLRDHAGEFDVFHGLNCFHPTVAPAFTAEQLGLPAVVFAMNSRVELSDKPGLKGLMGLPRRRRAMVKQLSGIIAMSDAINEELTGYGVPPEKIARIPMGVDPDRFHPEPDEARRRELRRDAGWPDRPTFIFVGAVNRRKRPHLMLEAVALLAQRGVDCQLALAGPAGDEEYVAEMKARAEALGVTPRIIWHGFTEDVAPLLRASDVFGLVSGREGMSAAVVEAMSSGLPAIVTDISGMRDLIDDGVQGRIVDPSPERVADALGEYIGDPQRARAAGEAARRRVEQHYSVGAVVGMYEQLFRRVMAGRAAAR
jgi:glycosyltransferase involved in cell wall biosynthesis